MKTRVVSIFLSLILLSSVFSVLGLTAYADDKYGIMLISEFQETSSFSDVPDGQFYTIAVNWAAENGITVGADSTHFNPSGITTRAQAITFLYRAAGSPDTEEESCSFEDVKVGSYYYDAVLWAVENGVTEGTSDKTFSPDDAVTRAQFVTFLARYAGVKNDSAGYTHDFTDVDQDAYYSTAVAWAYEKEIANGTSYTTFSPDKECMRCETVTFLYRYFNQPAAVVGGWTVQNSLAADLTEDDQKIFDEAASQWNGGNLTAVALLGTQVVSGVNYCYLAESSLGSYVLVYIYRDLQGYANLLKVTYLDLTAESFGGSDSTGLMGGWTVAEETHAVVYADDAAVLDEAQSGFTGAGYRLVVTLGTQVAAGTNYLMLCEKTLVTAAPVRSFAIVKVYQGLDGTAEITSILPLSIAAMRDAD